jgi:hypothetical protein
MSKAPDARLYPIGAIATHARLQIRGGTDHATVRRYKKAMQAGESFPAITLAEIGGKLYVVDGHHRLEATEAAGLSTILGTHRRMSLDAAHREAALSNAKHARPLNRKEKQNAFASFIEHSLHVGLSGKTKPVRTIAAEFPHYSFQTVSRKLKEMGIDAPREDVGEWRYTTRGSDEPTPEDLELEDAILLGEFRKHLDAATTSYGLLTDASRCIALTALKALMDDLEPPLGYLEI